MSIKPYPVTGIRDGLGPGRQVPVRQEIDAWSSDPKNLTQVNLFVLALAKFQSLNPKEMLSYFQIAGIHGQPHVAWDENKPAANPGEGYCTHQSILFPTWHRPYLALVEQRLHEIMIHDIIPGYPPAQREGMIKAANAWRLPYWDWAATGKVPKLCTMPKFEVDTATGVPSSIDNPLYKFSMPGRSPMGLYGISPSGPYPFDKCWATSRHPPPPPQINAWISGVENNDEVDQALKGRLFGASLAEAVYRLFTYKADYETFATTAMRPAPNPREYLNCEAIHNNIHGWTGGRGHMGDPDYAAFDPIFWLHHCNIDRQFSIWQTIFPNEWFDNPKTPIPDPGTWSIPAGNDDTPKTLLRPFHKDAHGSYYDSDGIRKWFQFGYSYTELQPWLPKYNPGGVFKEALYITDLKNQINRLYSHTRSLFLGQTPPSLTGTAGGAPAQAPLQTAAQAAAVQVPTQTFGEVETPGVKHPDYVINIRYEKHALNGAPYDVKLYIGPPEDPSPTYVGSVYNFSSPLPENPEAGGCANCKKQKEMGILSSSQIPITGVLLHHIEDESKSLWSLDEDKVEEYLTKHLHWRVHRYGHDAPLPTVPNLKVSVASGTAIHYEDHRALSDYEEYRVLYPITHGRDGGLHHHEQY